MWLKHAEQGTSIAALVENRCKIYLLIKLQDEGRVHTLIVCFLGVHRMQDGYIVSFFRQFSSSSQRQTSHRLYIVNKVMCTKCCPIIGQKLRWGRRQTPHNSFIGPHNGARLNIFMLALEHISRLVHVTARSNNAC